MEKKSYKNKELLKRFKPYYRPYKNILTADLLAAALTTVSSLVLPILLSYLTDWAQMGLLDVSRVTKVGIIFVLTKILELAARYFMQSLGHIMGAKIERDMRSDVFNHLLTMDTEFFNETKIGVLMSRITTDLFDITEFAHHVPEEFLVGALKLIISFIVLLTINWKLALIIYVIIPIMFVVSSKKRKEFREATLNVKKQIGDINSGVEDTLFVISVVKSFANEKIYK